MKAIVIVLALAFLQGFPPANERAPATEGRPATLEGFVVRAGTRTPVTRARVTLHPIQSSVSAATATTDGGGKFVFLNVAPGTYRIESRREGYVAGGYPEGVGAPLTLRPGERVNDLVVSMTPTGVISGRIYDPYGEPIVGAVVEALRFAYGDERRMLTQAQEVETNDRGEYRLYWLEPDAYVVRVSPRGNRFGGNITLSPDGRTSISMESFQIRLAAEDQAAVRDMVRALEDGPDTGEANSWASVYYPGTPDPAFAAAIDLAAGIDYSGVDFRVEEIPTQAIRGRVIGESGAEIERVSLRLVPRRSLVLVGEPIPTASVGPETARSSLPGSFRARMTWWPHSRSVRGSLSWEGTAGASGMWWSEGRVPPGCSAACPSRSETPTSTASASGSGPEFTWKDASRLTRTARQRFLRILCWSNWTPNPIWVPSFSVRVRVPKK